MKAPHRIIVPGWLHHPTEPSKLFRSYDEAEKALANGWSHTPTPAPMAEGDAQNEVPVPGSVQAPPCKNCEMLIAQNDRLNSDVSRMSQLCQELRQENVELAGILRAKIEAEHNLQSTAAPVLEGPLPGVDDVAKPAPAPEPDAKAKLTPPIKKK